MKINGQEVDMQKVVQLIEKEQKTVSDETKKKIKDWWDTTQGQLQKERNREKIKDSILKGCHRQKNKFTLRNVEDENDYVVLLGGQAVAEFLGYKKWNSSMDVSFRANKSKTKYYYMIREEL